MIPGKNGNFALYSTSKRLFFFHMFRDIFFFVHSFAISVCIFSLSGEILCPNSTYWLVCEKLELFFFWIKIDSVWKTYGQSFSWVFHRNSFFKMKFNFKRVRSFTFNGKYFLIFKLTLIWIRQINHDEMKATEIPNPFDVEMQ